MERIKKYLIVLAILIFASSSSLAVESTTPMYRNTVMVPQNIQLAQCIKTFNVGFEKLFVLTETAINYNGYDINEIQSKGGYIVFSVNQYKFLTTVYTFGANNAILKITPCNDIYTFPPMIITNIFKYIGINQYKKF